MKESVQPTEVRTSTLPNSIGEFARATLSDSLKSVRKALKRAARDWKETPEHVHQLRVKGRRALAALELFSDAIPKSNRKWLHKRLKAILQAAGDARDLDVLIQDQLPRCGKAAKRLKTIWHIQRRKCQKRIVGLYDKSTHKHCLRNRVRDLLKRVTDPAEPGSHRPGCEVWATNRLQELSTEFLEAVPKVSEVHALHRFRILAKRLRYSIDLLQPALPEQQAKELRTTLADLQTQLGALQDHVVAEEALTHSLEYFSESSDRTVLSDLIEDEHRRIAAMSGRFSSWEDSPLGRHFSECLNEISQELKESQP